MPDEFDPTAEPLFRFFTFEHLPEGIMRDTSRHFQAAAGFVIYHLPRSAERTVALRKLLEAKDAAVRAALDSITDGSVQ